MLDAHPRTDSLTNSLKTSGTSTNDRLFIGILKDLGFLNRDGAPQVRYFEFLDRSRAKQIVGAGIRDAFQELFAVNVRANELGLEEVKNKLSTMYAGKKTDLVIGNIAKTFKALCEYADFSAPSPVPVSDNGATDAATSRPPKSTLADTGAPVSEKQRNQPGRISVSGLQYHINIVLPDSRDQAVCDAISEAFASTWDEGVRPLLVRLSGCSF